MNHSFYFYKYYLEVVQQVPEEYQSELLSAIIRYGVTEEDISVNPVVQAIFAQLKASINASIDRYLRFKRLGDLGGRPREINWDIVYELHKLGYSNLEISKRMCCSVRSVRRIIKNKQSPKTYEQDRRAWGRKTKYRNFDLGDIRRQHPNVKTFARTKDIEIHLDMEKEYMKQEHYKNVRQKIEKYLQTNNYNKNMY